MMENKSTTKYEGPMGPVIASILGIVAWLIFILIYALYWSENFDLFQNVIVTIISLCITGLFDWIDLVDMVPPYWRASQTGSYRAW